MLELPYVLLSFSGDTLEELATTDRTPSKRNSPQGSA